MAAAARPRVLKDVLPAALFESFRFYVAEMQRAGAFQWEEWGRRHVRHNDPFAVLVHEAVRPVLETALGRRVKRSYSYVACYGDGGHVPAHVDRAQCRYTLDLCLEDGGAPWPLFVGGRPYIFGPNEALVYRGCDLVHYRDTKPPGQRSHLVFFHFVDPRFRGPLD